MTISREKCLEWARKAGFNNGHFFTLSPLIEALINRAYQEWQRDMRERAARSCTNSFTAEGIRNLEIE